VKLIASLVAVVACTVSFSRAEDFSSAVLAEMNLARTQPQTYARIVESRMAGARSKSTQNAAREAVRFLQKQRPLPPLAESPGLSRAALSHVLDRGPRGTTGHTGSDGSSPWSRMARYGRKEGYAGENIFYGRRDPRGVVVALIVDEGVPGRKHRANIFHSAFRTAGVAEGYHARFGKMWVMDFATAFHEGSRSVASR
jgi:uncharacterized protein YkwD